MFTGIDYRERIAIRCDNCRRKISSNQRGHGVAAFDNLMDRLVRLGWCFYTVGQEHHHLCRKCVIKLSPVEVPQ